jgi:hypothetical protein
MGYDLPSGFASPLLHPLQPFYWGINTMNDNGVAWANKIIQLPFVLVYKARWIE